MNLIYTFSFSFSKGVDVLFSFTFSRGIDLLLFLDLFN